VGDDSFALLVVEESAKETIFSKGQDRLPDIGKFHSINEDTNLSSSSKTNGSRTQISPAEIVFLERSISPKVENDGKHVDSKLPDYNDGRSSYHDTIQQGTAQAAKGGKRMVGASSSRYVSSLENSLDGALMVEDSISFSSKEK
ncbi:hypothetical protein Ancab_022128, partial [Ancistrocladus abbreviatus]